MANLKSDDWRENMKDRMEKDNKEAWGVGWGCRSPNTWMIAHDMIGCRKTLSHVQSYHCTYWRNLMWSRAFQCKNLLVTLTCLTTPVIVMILPANCWVIWKISILIILFCIIFQGRKEYPHSIFCSIHSQTETVTAFSIINHRSTLNTLMICTKAKVDNFLGTWGFSYSSWTFRESLIVDRLVWSWSTDL